MAIIIEIKVVPCSGRCAFHVDAQGKLKAYLKSAPEGGKANAELLKLLATALHCPLADFCIVSGQTIRLKKIKINLPLTHDDIINKLGFAVQTKLI